MSGDLDAATSSLLRSADADAPLREMAQAPVFTVLQRLAATPRGLTEAEAADRLRTYGENEPFRAPDQNILARLLAATGSSFVALLIGLGVVFGLLGDPRGAVTVAVIVALAVALRFWQQTRSLRATRSLQHLVSATVTARRRAGAHDAPVDREVPLADVVPGDIVVLRAGDLVPADVRILSATDLSVNQSILSGESLPRTKAATREPDDAEIEPVVDAPSLCFSGTAVVAGTATGVVIATGERTYFGSLARDAWHARPQSSFDSGVRAVGWTLIRFMVVLAPIVFLVNGALTGVWTRAAMFAAAVAVGLTPEMLPVIVTTNLARGAARLARDKVVASRLDAIQDLGGVDVLCVDKTATLTEDRVVYAHSVDVTGRFDQGVAEFAYLAVHFGSMLLNRLDEAIIDMLAEPDLALIADAAYTRVGEVGFDDIRRRNTVVVSRYPGEHILLCKGDPDEVLPLCSEVRVENETVPLGDDWRAEIDDLLTAYRSNGMRVLAIAIREAPARLERYDDTDEHDLVLVGFVGFVDPIRESAGAAVASLAAHGVTVKVLTGDNKSVAMQVAGQVGVDPELAVVGRELDGLTERQLATAVSRTHVFAELAPAHKARIVVALRENGHAVGFLGDGVNDVAALRIADAGIAADTATDVAKHAADLILLDKDLAVVAAAVVEGRRTLANTMKYVKITASSNFGNVLSVVAASAFLPFLPMLPIQLMVQNLRTAAMELRRAHHVHAHVRHTQFGVRPRDLRGAVVGVRRRPPPAHDVSDRVVRRRPADPAAGGAGVAHPYPAVARRPSRPRGAGRRGRGGRDRLPAAADPAGRRTQDDRAAARLRPVGHHGAAGLCRGRPVGQTALHPSPQTVAVVALTQAHSDK
jgi:Mg2+-importing ATPase